MAPGTGRPMVRISVLVSLRVPDKKFPLAGAVTRTSFHVGVTFPVTVT